MNGASRMAVGILTGAAIGAALGVLYAPKSGEAMRRDLSRSAHRLKRRAGRVYDDASEAIEDLAARGTRAVERASEAAGRVADYVRG